MGCQLMYSRALMSSLLHLQLSLQVVPEKGGLDLCVDIAFSVMRYRVGGRRCGSGCGTGNLQQTTVGQAGRANWQ